MYEGAAPDAFAGPRETPTAAQADTLRETVSVSLWAVETRMMVTESTRAHCYYPIKQKNMLLRN